MTGCIHLRCYEEHTTLSSCWNRVLWLLPMQKKNCAITTASTAIKWTDTIERSGKTVSRLGAVDFFQKTNKQIWFFAILLFMAKKQNLFVCFFGRIYGAPICFRFFLTIKDFTKFSHEMFHVR